jgi:methionine-gamma-lyase
MLRQDKRYGEKTRAIHAGEAPDPTTGASSPNLVMSTTFALDDTLDSFSALGAEASIPYVYTRWGNPTIRQLEQKLADLEGGEAGVAFSSGMAAANGLLFHLLARGDHLVVSDVAYAGVAELTRNTLVKLGIDVTPADLSDLDDLRHALRPNTKLVWAETPANPILRLTDIRAVAEIVHAAGAELAVDSTFATPIATRPLELGADFVIHSLTKYIGGHGDALGGAIVGRADRLAALRQDTSIHLGATLSPFNAWLILRGMATLPLRMAAHAQNALEVARFLQSHRRVRRVIYPGLDSHPQAELARRQMTNFSGMLTFQVDDGAEVARQCAKRLDVFHYAVSLGHHRSLIFYLPTQDMQENSFRLDAEHLARYRQFAGDGIFRVSIGLENAEDLCDDLDRVL